MITAKEWMLYILANNLEDEPIFKDGKPLGFLTIVEAAAKFDVGMATVRVWINEDMLPAILVGNETYIPMTAERPNV